MSVPNGRSTPVEDHRSHHPRESPHSDSDLSEPDPEVIEGITLDQEDGPDSMQDVIHEMETSESDNEEDAEGEDDADYDVESPPPEEDALRPDSRSSGSSIRPSKRKASVDEEELMQQNPELYGLRRSHRARPTRRVIQSDSDDDDDASDINTGRARKRLKSAATSRPVSNNVSTARQTGSGSDSDDVYGGARGRDFAKRHRRLQAAASRDSPGLGDVRFSTRRAAKVSNYNENEDDDMFEEDDTENMTPNYWATAEEDTSPAIDVVLNHRVKDGVDHAAAEKHDYEFFIKWQGKAHYHATWEPWSTLSSYRGFRRLENYYRKIVREEQFILGDPDVAPEEREKWNLERETYLDALEDYIKVERVIGARDGEEEDTEYYVKWKGLSYDCSTWENASLVSELAQGEIDRYLDRSSKLPVSDKREMNPNTRAPYKPFRTQPDYIKHGQLREFQITGVNFLAHNWCNSNNVVLADEMGLGKTVQTVSFMNWLRHDRGQQGPFLVIVPLSTMPAWADTLNNWAPDINYVVYNGNEASRKIIQEYELLVDGNPRRVKFHVLLTTYEYILIDNGFLSQLKWQFMAVDEAHRLKNKESQLYIKLMDFGIPSRLLITGTPLQNNLTELSSLMNFLMPGMVALDDDIDLSSDTAKQKLDDLNTAIKPYMIRRTKQKVENDLPPKTEKIIRVELSDVQLEYYKNILTRNYTALNAGAKGQKQSLLNIMMELKKASNHPFMFPNAEERILGGKDSREEQLKALITSSGKMMLLDQLLTKMKKDGHRVLIFSQMVRMLDILGDYLALRGHQFQRLDGTIPSAARRQAIDHFNAPDSKDFCFCLSTRAGGLGINLMTADTVILFDSDWNPQADLQAMARAHRIGQKNPVTIYRLVSKDTVEEEVLERARNKLMLEYITIHRAITDKDAKQLNDTLSKAGVGTVEPSSSDDISRILKRRGQKMFEQTGNQKKLEELDIDAVLANAEEHTTEQDQGITADGGEEFLKSFEYTDVKVDLEWDEIIPKEQLEKIKEEERRKEEAKYLESVIEANQPRKRKAPGEDTREQRAAKKRARDLAVEAAADVESDNESVVGKDPKRPLNEKEVRNLIRAFERYGSIEERQDELVREARLIGRDINVLKATLTEILDECNRLLKEEEDRIRAIERETNKPITKKDKKAVLFDYHGVKRLNAETLTERPIEMSMLKDVVNNTSDWRNFRLPEASKPAHYTAPWGAREDGMLMVGINKYGYGAWTAIRDDPELNMQDRFFLEEHRVGVKEERGKADDKNIKSPGAVHLVRRSNYLLSVLKDKTSNGTNIAARRALENHHRNNKKNRLSGVNGRPESGSPAPSSMHKLHRENSDRHRGHSQFDQRSSMDRRLGPNSHHAGSPKLHKRPNGDHRTDERRPHQLSNGTSATGGLRGTDDRIKQRFRSIRESLDYVSRASRHEMPDQDKRLKIIKQSLLVFGRHIASEMKKENAMEEKKLWDYIADYYWPQGKSKKEGARVTGEMIQKMYKRMEEKEKAQEGSGQNGTPPVKKESAQPAETKDVKKEIKAETATPAPTVAPADGVKKEEEKEDGEI
ncbi:SNF2 family N-terminal domain-containing protein 7 [Elsinoe australis]|uniref:SNF2 family N-terminal domain-containing protein 7 n=1 Tax=Elsinoe australis TaxID=40998 RepID=A0A4V6DVH1_9PEZI|nr:SNF2 family N-terminal domain-containing protein 7 [Elsinoe australis]